MTDLLRRFEFGAKRGFIGSFNPWLVLGSVFENDGKNNVLSLCFVFSKQKTK